MKKFKHIEFNKHRSSKYSPPSGGSRDTKKIVRDKNVHGNFLKTRFESAWQTCSNELVDYAVEKDGFYLQFKGFPDLELVTKSLENESKKIRLLNIRNDSQGTQAVVFIPNNQKDYFLKKIKEYLESDPSKLRNAKLINSIQEIQAALDVNSFWIGDVAFQPTLEPAWCEIWLRYEPDTNQVDYVKSAFMNLLKSLKITHKDHFLKFPERLIFVAFANRDQLNKIIQKSPYVAECRRASDINFFIQSSIRDQRQWSDDLLSRLQYSENYATNSVCLLDTGVNRGHPLLMNVLKSENCQVVNPNWAGEDQKGHGSLMAGLSAYGNLKNALMTSGSIVVSHSLESVKILPDDEDTKADLWGWITQSAISLAEINAPFNKRVFCMAVTSSHFTPPGHPTSWSSTIDKICSGADEEEPIKRLIFISCGNNLASSQYPSSVINKQAEDPSQAWNAISVGAYTELTQILDPTYRNYASLAPSGGISPFSSCSSEWGPWPIKPEIVMEGGNLAVDQSGFCIDRCNDISLLTTSSNQFSSLFESFNMTSAATAQASWLAAKIQSRYPHYWPETVRALIVHSAEWTDTMKRQFVSKSDLEKKGSREKILRICGYGVPNLDRALFSAANTLTLIAETEIQPYRKEGSRYQANEMHLFNLPWPQDQLMDLGDSEVKMRITLSYFIEPGPGELGFNNKYRYSSYGLRFDINSPLESESEFIKRINKAAERDEDDLEAENTQSAYEHWYFGKKIRDKGSIHSDIWEGTAPELAKSNLIAIYPVIGWWRERHNEKKYDSKARYSLIVSIISKNEEIDIYTPVAIQVGIPIENIIEIAT